MAKKMAVPASILQLLEKRDTKERRAEVRRAKKDRRAAASTTPTKDVSPARAGTDIVERRSGTDRRKAVQRRRKIRRNSG